MSKFLAITLVSLWILFLFFQDQSYGWIFRGLLSSIIGSSCVYLWRYSELAEALMKLLQRDI